MSQEILKNSLLKSSLSIDRIRKSVTNFTKGMRGAQKTASKIVEQTSEDNKFKTRLLSKENSFFRKRREAVRRREREDEIEASSIGGVLKRQGTVIGKSTKGFLGRILDFFGIVLIGWMVTKLPGIIKTVEGLMQKMRVVSGIMGGFINILTKVVVGIGGFLFNGINTLRGYNWREQKEDITRDVDKVQKGFLQLESGFVQGLNEFNDPKQAYMNDSWQKFPDEVDGTDEGEGDDQGEGEVQGEVQGEGEGEVQGEGEGGDNIEGKNQWWDFLDIFPNKKNDAGNTVEGDDSDDTKDDPQVQGQENNVDTESIKPDVEGLSQSEIDDAVNENKTQEAEFNMFNKGGEVKGKEGIDQIAAKLTKGEFVIQKQIAEKNKEFLKMFNSGKFSPMQSMNQVKQNFNEEEMMSGINSAMGQVGKLPFDKLGDFPMGELTKNIESLQEEFNIEPKGRERNLEIKKLTTPRKPKSTMIIKTINKSSNSGSMTLQIPKSVKSMGGSQSSVNSTIKTLQELESAFT